VGTDKLVAISNKPHVPVGEHERLKDTIAWYIELLLRGLFLCLSFKANDNFFSIASFSS
jgi:hypothetical protein